VAAVPVPRAFTFGFRSVCMSEQLKATTKPVTRADRTTRMRRPRVRLGAVVVLAALAGLVIWLISSSGGGGSKPSTQGRTSPVAVSARSLSGLARSLGHPIYWLGRSAGTTYELTTTTDRVYIRYLPARAKVGDRRPFLTVGTYPMRNAFGVIDSGSRQQGVVRLSLPAGGVGIYRPKHPHNVYLAYPGSDYQIEVYAPRAGLARRLVTTRGVQAIGGRFASSSAVAVSVNRLKALATSLGQPIYWAGSRPRITYEFTRTVDGKIYIRYLPAGVPVGASTPYLTVGTYPVRNAFRVTREAGSGAKSVKISIGGGAIAVYSRGHSKNVYVAYPGSNFQIEVFDPKADAAKRLVTSQSIAPVR
jgi:hypothetical protein